MRCYKCKGEFVAQEGTVTLNDRIIGKYSVDDIRYLKCNSCGELAYPPGVSTIIDRVKQERLEYLIGQLPLDDFITATEVAEILGISRQAVHKHPRIRNGFIHARKYGGRWLYSRKSVELYKDTGDGRFPLGSNEPEVKTVAPPKSITKYIVIPGWQYAPVPQYTATNTYINHDEESFSGRTPSSSNWIS